MLELMGRHYVIDHCLHQLKKLSEEKVFRIYLTDALKALTENTGRLVKDGVKMSTRFCDLIEEKEEQSPEEKASDEIKAQEIISMMRERLSKLGGKEGG